MDGINKHVFSIGFPGDDKIGKHTVHKKSRHSFLVLVIFRHEKSVVLLQKMQKHNQKKNAL